MLIHTLKYSQTLLVVSILAVIGCSTPDTNTQNVTEEKGLKNEDGSADRSTVESEGHVSKDVASVDTFEVIVVQCANGYEYAMYNYDFNPVIERELNTFETIDVKPFPYKTLMGVAYQGVFDKKYCPPIIEKVDADFLILTRFDKRYDELNRKPAKWGYELRIVNTKTLEQVNTISAHGLEDYTAIETHIRKNIERLKSDIEALM